jgi:hypothetical protein
MDKLLSRLMEKYGLLPIAIAIILGTIIVWGLAHYTAAPGGNVSVLWGLVQYTKVKPSQDTPIIAAPSSPDLAKLTLIQSQRSIELPIAATGNFMVINAVTKANMDSTLKSIRKKQGLRALATLESGRRLADTARQTYFFVSFLYLKKHEDKKAFDIGDANVDRFGKYDGYFEVHLGENGPPNIVGFTSETDAGRLGGSNNDIHNISIASVPWEKMTSLVLLPTSRILRAEYRTVNLSEDDRITVLDLKVR